VLIIFGIMLTNKITDAELKTKNLSVVPAAIFVIIFTALLIFVMVTTQWKVAVTPQVTEVTVGKIGTLLLTDYLLPFEIASIILLIALIGAAMYSRKEKIKIK